MSILERARRFESRLARTVETAAQRLMRSSATEPLEVMHRVLEAIRDEVQPAGRGKRVFPFNRIQVSVLAPSAAMRARADAVFDGAQPLPERISQTLRSAGCDATDPDVLVVYASEAAPHWKSPEYNVEFARVEHAVDVIPPSVSEPTRIGLTIAHGSAEHQEYSFTLSRIDLGRCAEVRDGRNRLIRTNHVAFTDVAEENHSVSRRHAHIEYSAASNEYRVYDDRSAHGTGVLRSGRTIAVPPGSRGIRLQSGDEIVLGEVRVRVDLTQLR